MSYRNINTPEPTRQTPSYTDTREFLQTITRTIDNSNIKLQTNIDKVIAVINKKFTLSLQFTIQNLIENYQNLSQDANKLNLDSNKILYICAYYNILGEDILNNINDFNNEGFNIGRGIPIYDNIEKYVDAIFFPSIEILKGCLSDLRICKQIGYLNHTNQSPDNIITAKHAVIIDNINNIHLILLDYGHEQYIIHDITFKIVYLNDKAGIKRELDSIYLPIYMWGLCCSDVVLSIQTVLQTLAKKINNNNQHIKYVGIIRYINKRTPIVPQRNIHNCYIIDQISNIQSISIDLLGKDITIKGTSYNLFVVSRTDIDNLGDYSKKDDDIYVESNKLKLPAVTKLQINTSDDTCSIFKIYTK